MGIENRNFDITARENKESEVKQTASSFSPEVKNLKENVEKKAELKRFIDTYTGVDKLDKETITIAFNYFHTAKQSLLKIPEFKAKWGSSFPDELLFSQMIKESNLRPKATDWEETDPDEPIGYFEIKQGATDGANAVYGTSFSRNNKAGNCALGIVYYLEKCKLSNTVDKVIKKDKEEFGLAMYNMGPSGLEDLYLKVRWGIRNQKEDKTYEPNREEFVRYIVEKGFKITSGKKTSLDETYNVQFADWFDEADYSKNKTEAFGVKKSKLYEVVRYVEIIKALEVKNAQGEQEQEKEQEEEEEEEEEKQPETLDPFRERIKKEQERLTKQLIFFIDKGHTIIDPHFRGNPLALEEKELVLRIAGNHKNISSFPNWSKKLTTLDQRTQKEVDQFNNLYLKTRGIHIVKLKEANASKLLKAHGIVASEENLEKFKEYNKPIVFSDMKKSEEFLIWGDENKKDRDKNENNRESNEKTGPFDFHERIESIEVISHEFSGYVFLIDPGHGGIDPGAPAVGYKGTGEKITVLEAPNVYDVSLRLVKYLTERGATVDITHYYTHRGVSNKTDLKKVAEIPGPEVSYMQDVYNHSSYGNVAYGGEHTIPKRKVIIDNIANKYQKEDKFKKKTKAIFSLSIHADNKGDTRKPIIVEYNGSGTGKDLISKGFAEDLVDPKVGGLRRKGLGSSGEYFYEEAKAEKDHATNNGLGILKTSKTDAEVLVELVNMGDTETNTSRRLREASNRQIFAEQIGESLLKTCKYYNKNPSKRP